MVLLGPWEAAATGVSRGLGSQELTPCRSPPTAEGARLAWGGAALRPLVKSGAHFSSIGRVSLCTGCPGLGRGYGSDMTLSLLPSSKHPFIFVLYPSATTFCLETLILVKVFWGMDSGSNGFFWGMTGWLEGMGVGVGMRAGNSHGAILLISSSEWWPSLF